MMAKSTATSSSATPRQEGSPTRRGPAYRVDLTEKIKKAAMAALLGRELPMRGNVDMHCALPGHDDGTESMSVNAKGLWHCHGCNIGGDVVDLVAKTAGLDKVRDFRRIAERVLDLADQNPHDAPGEEEESGDTFFRPTFKQILRAMAQAYEYLTGRLISLASASHFGFYVGYDNDGDAYVGFRSSSGTTRRYLDGRSKPHKRIGQRGPSPLLGMLPGSDFTVELAIIAEAIIDALSFIESGESEAYSLPNGTPSVEKIRDCLEELASRVKTWVIATDGDEAGEKAAEEIVDVLFGAGAEDVRRVHYPDGTKDANEVLVKYGSEAVRALCEEATPFFPSKHPKRWADPLFEEREPRVPIVDRLISEGDRVVLHGAQESFKTTVALMLVLIYLSAVEGNWSLGPLPVSGRGRVLIINEEQRREQLEDTLLRVARGMGITQADIEEWSTSGRLTTVSQQDVHPERREWQDKLAHILDDPEPCLIIIDSWRHLLGDIDENTTGGLKILKALDHLIRNGRHTVLLIAHETKSKGGRRSQGINAISGSNVVAGWTDVGLRFVRKATSPTVTVEVTKGRHLKDVPSSFDLVADSRHGGVLLVSATGAGASPSPSLPLGPSKRALSALAKEALMALRGGLVGGPANRNQIRIAMGDTSLKYPELGSALGELVTFGVVRKDDSNPKSPIYAVMPGSKSAVVVGGGLSKESHPHKPNTPYRPKKRNNPRKNTAKRISQSGKKGGKS